MGISLINIARVLYWPVLVLFLTSLRLFPVEWLTSHSQVQVQSSVMVPPGVSLLQGEGPARGSAGMTPRAVCGHVFAYV